MSVVTTFRFWTRTAKQAIHESCGVFGFSWGKVIRATLSVLFAVYFVAHVLKQADLLNGRVRWIVASVFAIFVVFMLVFVWKLLSIPGRTKKEDDGTISHLRARLNPPTYAHLRDVIKRLMDGYSYGQKEQSDERFSFCMGIEELKSLGAFDADLLHMAKNGLIDYGDAIRRNGIDGTAIRKNPRFNTDTVFWLTPEGIEWATSEFGIRQQ